MEECEMSELIKKLEQQSYEMKLKALELAQSTSFGAHIGGGFSSMEITWLSLSNSTTPKRSGSET